MPKKLPKSYIFTLEIEKENLSLFLGESLLQCVKESYAASLFFNEKLLKRLSFVNLICLGANLLILDSVFNSAKILKTSSERKSSSASIRSDQMMFISPFSGFFNYFSIFRPKIKSHELLHHDSYLKSY